MGRKTLANQKKKMDAVFKVAGHKSLKAKGRAKPVNFKSFKTRDQVEQSNKQLDAIRELVSCPVKRDHDRPRQDDSPKPEQQLPPKTSVNDITRLQKRMQIKG